MQESPTPEWTRAVQLAGDIADRPVRRLFSHFVDVVSKWHDEVRAETSDLEVRIYYRNAFLCRLVPYRQLFHVQIGEAPTWETRVRNQAAFLETVDRTLDRFLQIHAANAPR